MIAISHSENIYILINCIVFVLLHRTHPFHCILPHLYHVTASLRIRHATQAAKPERIGVPLRAILFDAERSRDLSASKRMGLFGEDGEVGEVGELNRIGPMTNSATTMRDGALVAF